MTTFQVLAAHDAFLNEYWSDQQKRYSTSVELRPNAIICVFYADGVKGVAEQFGLQNPTVRVKSRKGLLRELVFDSYNMRGLENLFF
jgi:hypothetical protein